MTEGSLADTNPNNTALLDSWRSNARRWTRAVRTGEIVSRISCTNDAILNAIKRLGPSRVLDLGCGEGWLCRSLTSAGISCTGIDASRELIEIARASDTQSWYVPLSYSELVRDAAPIGKDFDVIVANFSLLDATVEELFTALPKFSGARARLVIQTLHPFHIPGTYRTGWKEETFGGSGTSDWSPMPWYFRRLTDWIALLHPNWMLERMEEPQGANDAFPASLLLTASRNDKTAFCAQVR